MPMIAVQREWGWDGSEGVILLETTIIRIFGTVFFFFFFFHS